LFLSNRGLLSCHVHTRSFRFGSNYLRRSLAVMPDIVTRVAA
jgi:hypothetical protein